jgi:hypothetical protein
VMRRGAQAKPHPRLPTDLRPFRERSARQRPRVAASSLALTIRLGRQPFSGWPTGGRQDTATPARASGQGILSRLPHLGPGRPSVANHPDRPIRSTPARTVRRIISAHRSAGNLAATRYTAGRAILQLPRRTTFAHHCRTTGTSAPGAGVRRLLSPYGLGCCVMRRLFAPDASNCRLPMGRDPLLQATWRTSR